MKTSCIVTAIILVVAFSAVNLFLPYAVLILAAAVALGIPCGVLRLSKYRSCRMGTC